MKSDVQEDTKLRRYLFGELTLEEQVLVERRLFLDSEYAELAQTVEYDLIDEYLHNDLSAAERGKFERHFLKQPEHRADLRIAEALKKYQAGTSDTSAGASGKHELPFPFFSKPIVRWSLAAAALIILAIIVFIGFRSRNSNAPLQAEEPRAPKTQPQEQQQRGPVVPDNQNTEETTQKRDRANQNTDKPLKPPSQAAQITTFIIMPGGVARSGGGRNIVTLTGELQSVILRLPLTLTEPYHSYRVELLSGNRTIYRQEFSTTEVDEELGSVVSLTVPAKLLSGRNYKLKLSGVTDEQSSSPKTYSFVVDRK